jgi:hypothetical protein
MGHAVPLGRVMPQVNGTDAARAWERLKAVSAPDGDTHKQQPTR